MKCLTLASLGLSRDNDRSFGSSVCRDACRRPGVVVLEIFNNFKRILLPFVQ